MKTRFLNFFRRLTGRPIELFATGPCHCCMCGAAQVSVISTLSDKYDPTTGAIGGVECGACHRMSSYSD